MDDLSKPVAKLEIDFTSLSTEWPVIQAAFPEPEPPEDAPLASSWVCGSPSLTQLYSTLFLHVTEVWRAGTMFPTWETPDPIKLETL